MLFAEDCWLEEARDGTDWAPVATLAAAAAVGLLWPVEDVAPTPPPGPPEGGRRWCNMWCMWWWCIWCIKCCVCPPPTPVVAPGAGELGADALRAVVEERAAFAEAVAVAGGVGERWDTSAVKDPLLVARVVCRLVVAFVAKTASAPASASSASSIEVGVRRWSHGEPAEWSYN